MSLFDNLRNEQGGGLAWTVAIHFPAFEEFTAKSLYYSTAVNLDLGDSKNYLPLIQMVRGRHQRDRGNDYAEFNIINADSLPYQDFYPYEDLIEMAQVVINECVLVEDTFWEKEQRFFGYIQDYTLDDKNKTINFTAISDMNKEGRLIGSVISRERCDAEFNYNGLIAPEYHICGWQTAQGGNPIFCSRLLTGVDSCTEHNNTHRFHALRGLVDAPVTIISDNEPSTGFEYKSDACFTASMRVLMADKTLKPINEVGQGDKILGFDIFDNDKLIEGEVLERFDHLAKEILIAKFYSGRLRAIIETTNEHLFYIGNRQFLNCGSLEGSRSVKQAYGINSEQKPLKSPLIAKERSFERCSLHNLHTTTNNFIITDELEEIFFFVHNNKYDYYIN